MSKRTPGLRKKGKYWQVEKVIAGQLIRCSTGETELDQAERFLAKLIDERRRVVIYGERIERTFDEAAARYIEDYGFKKSMDRDITTLKAVMPYIGNIELRKIHSVTLENFIQDRRKNGISAGTLNRDISIIKRVLKLSAALWRDENGRPWLDTVPMLIRVQGPQRQPKPISWVEQDRLLKAMPKYLADMCLFALNTGLRDQEICCLQWQHEFRITGADRSVFIIPEGMAKNKRERVVVLNQVAERIIDSNRGHDSDYVFSRNGQRLSRINNRAWRTAVKSAGLVGVRVHDLRHTFGKRLRSAGVSFEDRQDLLGHHAGRITTHYSKVEIMNLIECVDLLCETRKPELTLIRKTG